jgi:hypothetical protein
MYSAGNTAQIVIHYVGGESEAFNLYDTANPEEESSANLIDSLRQQVEGLLSHPWIFLQLAEETVCINTANVTRMEVRPVLMPLTVAGQLGSGERVTALTRMRS